MQSLPCCPQFSRGPHDLSGGGPMGKNKLKPKPCRGRLIKPEHQANLRVFPKTFHATKHYSYISYGHAINGFVDEHVIFAQMVGHMKTFWSYKTLGLFKLNFRERRCFPAESARSSRNLDISPVAQLSASREKRFQRVEIEKFRVPASPDI